MNIFAADIGGTKTNFGVYEIGGKGDDLRPVAQGAVFTGDYPDGDTMLADVVQKHAGGRRITAAAFGIAGPVSDGVCRGENLPWKVKEAREDSFAKTLKLDRVALLNDLAATANGVRYLKGEQIVTLNEGKKERNGHIAVIAAGTGLGEASLIYDRDKGEYEPLAMEGGHTDLAVRNDLEIELLKYLMKLERPVNQEAVLCGSGLFNVYNFFKDTGRYPEPDWLAREIAAADTKGKPGVVSKNGLEKKAEICVRTLDLFMAMYGARAGNLGMQIMAGGGVFVGGGIAPKNLDKIKDGTFMAAFKDKGPHFGPMVEKFPVYVVLEQKTALIGAAQYAVTHCVR